MSTRTKPKKAPAYGYKRVMLRDGAVVRRRVPIAELERMWRTSKKIKPLKKAAA